MFPRGGIYIVAINNQMSHAVAPALHARGRERLANEADGGMQRDAGLIGRTLTAAEDAIDAAVPELPARPSLR